MRRSRLLELSLAVVGFCAAGVAATPGVRALLAERRVAAAVSSFSSHAQAATYTTSGDGPIVPDTAISGTYLSNAVEDSGPSHVIGVLKMPSIHLAVPIISGIENSDLARGIGHVPGSGYAGGLGNMAVAGHRDTFFRPLRSAANGMEVFVSGSGGNYRYRVDRTEIVKPDQLKVLDIGNRPELTMITCYPFNFLGAAPDRFVVHAYLVSVDPEPATH